MKRIEIESRNYLSVMPDCNEFTVRIIDAPREESELKKWREISRLIQEEIMEKVKDALREEPQPFTDFGSMVSSREKRIAELETERAALQARIDNTLKHLHDYYSPLLERILKDILTKKDA